MKSTEKNFIKRLKRHEEDALEYIVEQYLPLVKGITQKILSPLKNNGLIDECINDIFLSIWNHSKKFHGNSEDFKKWICVISRFKSIDYYRKATKKKELISGEIEVNNEKSVEDELIFLENRNELIALINLLEPIDREILIMKYFLGFKTDEISAKLGITRSAIENRIYRSKKKLSKKATSLTLGGSLI